MRTMIPFLVLATAPAWGEPIPNAPAPRKSKALKLDLGKGQVGDLARHPGLTSLTLTGPFCGGW